MFALNVVALLLQLQIPQPVGYVNDFARVVQATDAQRMTALIEEVRSKSGGEIAVVTLPDLQGRPAMEVARDIGRQWGVGARGGPGDRARNAGVVILLKPGARPGDGRADVFIATGLGAEGFITDARAGQIRDAIGLTAVNEGSYSAGLLAGTWLVANQYAEEFGFELSGVAPPRSVPSPTSGGSYAWLPILVFFIFILPLIMRASGRDRRYWRGRSGLLPWIMLALLSSGGRRGHGGG